MKYLLGIDFGGSASKATLLSEEGSIVSEHSVEYPTYHDTPGACEQDAADWIFALSENVRSILEKSGVRSADISAVSVDSATHTFLLTDEHGTPLRRAVHWTDSRSREEADALRAEYGEMIFSKAFHKPDTIWTLPGLQWLRKHEPAVFSKAKRLYYEKDYIRWFLTDVFCTDYIEAEGSMLFDFRTLQWDDFLIALSGLSKDALPPVVSPTDIIGTVTEKAAEATGLAAGTPVIAGTTDTCMEVFASGAVSCGDMTVKLATAGRICVITDKPCPDRHLVNYSHIEKGLWYPGTATKAAASSYRWYRDTFGGNYAELDRAAEQIPAGAEGLFFHPYLNGELTPYADPLLSGSFVGIRANHTKAHFTRAVLEGVSFSLLDSKQYLDSLGIPYGGKAVLIGGGSKGTLWAQITADMLGIPLTVTETSDSSFGSAMLAGVATHVFASPKEAVLRCVKPVKTVTPDPKAHEAYLALFKDYKKIHDALAPYYDEKK